MVKKCYSRKFIIQEHIARLRHKKIDNYITCTHTDVISNQTICIKTWICPGYYRHFNHDYTTAGRLHGKMLVAFSISARPNHRGVIWGAIRVGHVFSDRWRHTWQNRGNCCLQLNISHSGQGGCNWSLMRKVRAELMLREKREQKVSQILEEGAGQSADPDKQLSYGNG